MYTHVHTMKLLMNESDVSVSESSDIHVREIDVPEYYGYGAKDFSHVRGLIVSLREELPTEYRNLEVFRNFLNGHERDDAIAFLATAKGSKTGNTLSPAARLLHQGHDVRNHLGGLLALCGLPGELTETRREIQKLVELAKNLSYGEVFQDVIPAV